MSDPPRSLRAALVRASVQAQLFGKSEPLRLGRYELREHVGSGAMGSVFLGRDADLERDVAVKVLGRGGDAERIRARLLREARAMAKLRHPNVVAVYEAGVIDERAFIAMEYVDGTTLRTWLGQPHSHQEILAAFRQAAEGLAAAHAAGVVHRDFKPDNALVGADGRVQVTDFGVAHAFDADEPRAGRQEAPAAAEQPATRGTDLSRAGTPRYMAPEQFDGAQIDGRTDQFAFCVALFEALYGAPPFEGESLAELAEAARRGAPTLPADRRGVPRHLEEALVRGMSADPGDRFATMGALVDAFEPPRPSSWPLWAAVAAALSLGAVLLVSLVEDESPVSAASSASAEAAPAPPFRASAASAAAAIDPAAIEMAAALAEAAISRAAAAVARASEGAAAPKIQASCGADGPACQLYGRCNPQGERCLASDNEHCRAAEICRLAGRCTASDGDCVAASDLDCAGSHVCQRDGACLARQGRCQPTAEP